MPPTTSESSDMVGTFPDIALRAVHDALDLVRWAQERNDHD